MNQYKFSALIVLFIHLYVCTIASMINPNGKFLIDLQKNKINVWNIANPNKSYVLNYPDVFTFSTGINHIAAWSADNDTIKVWNLNRLTARPIEFDVDYVIYDVFISENQNYLISYGMEGSTGIIEIRQLNNLTGTPKKISMSNIYNLYQVSLSSNRYLIAHTDQGIDVWDISNFPKERYMHRLTIEPNSIAVNSTRTYLAAEFPNNNTIAIWDYITKEELSTLIISTKDPNMIFQGNYLLYFTNNDFSLQDCSDVKNIKLILSVVGSIDVVDITKNNKYLTWYQESKENGGEKYFVFNIANQTYSLVLEAKEDMRYFVTPDGKLISLSLEDDNITVDNLPDIEGEETEEETTEEETEEERVSYALENLALALNDLADSLHATP